jgi:hypothetical protein
LALFEIFSEWGNKTKFAFWPSQIALLLLAPDVLSKLGTNTDSAVVRKKREMQNILLLFICLFIYLFRTNLLTVCR